ncbi:MAG: 16S rRNA (cytidine(1402)-2'-O)-methyltransferase [Desulfatiglandales bacterium]
MSTPIGNLKDITLRALEVLKSVDLILAESPLNTRPLLKAYDIRTPVHKLNQHARSKNISHWIQMLSRGYNIAYVSSAGSPGISDPGNWLVREALRWDIKVSPIPGPSAVTAAYSVSGMPSDGFVFLGFLSPKSSRRRKELEEFKEQRRPILIFESCHRISETIKDLLMILGNRNVVMVREASKLFEEVKLLDLKGLEGYLNDHELKGEITLIVEGRKGN